MNRIMKSMPDAMMAALQVGISYTLSAFSPNEVSFFTDFVLMRFVHFFVIAQAVS